MCAKVVQKQIYLTVEERKRLTSVGRSDPGRKRCGAVFVRFEERTAFEEVDLTRLDMFVK